MQTKTTTTTPAPKPDAQPVQAAIKNFTVTHADGSVTRHAGTDARHLTRGEISAERIASGYCVPKMDMDLSGRTDCTVRELDAQPVQAANFTPGPWEKRHLRIQKKGNYVADCDTSYMLSSEERHANARLIAAAPALLAALETIVEAGRMSDQPRAVYCSLIAQDALNAAKGGVQ
jgi:hypothetical protein